VGDIIKRDFIIIVFVLIAGLAGQVSAYTPEQQTLLEGMKLSSQITIAHEKAIQGQNVTEFNTLVDIYNAWIRQHFGEGADALLMSKMTMTHLPGIAQKQPYYQIESPPGALNSYATINPFNASSDLSKFGKQRVRTDLMGDAAYLEELSVQEKLKNF
jgi:hypothetical protein